MPAGPHAFLEVVGPVRATTIHFMLARGASGFQIGGKRMHQFFSVDVLRVAVRWFDLHGIFIHRVIVPVRTSIKTWLTNSIIHVTKLLMPKLNN